MLIRAYLSGFVAAALLLTLDNATSNPKVAAPPRSSSIELIVVNEAATIDRAALPTTPEAAPDTSTDVFCQESLADVLAKYPLDFRAGDDDLKSSVVRIVDAIAEVAMRCPAATVVINYPNQQRLSAARARRLVRRLDSRGVPAIAQASEAAELSIVFAD
ncbi:MAG: hypothetical protein AAFM91_15535 [Pseudomonadota bacterium]